MNHPSRLSRRELLKTGALAGAALTLPGAAAASAATPKAPPKDEDPWRGLKVGVASYYAAQAAGGGGDQGDPARRPEVRLDQRLSPRHEARRAAARRDPEVQGRRHHAAELRQHLDAERRGQRPPRLRVRPRRRHPDHRLQPAPDSMPLLDQMVKEFDIQPRDPQPRPRGPALPLALRRLEGGRDVRPADRPVHRRRPHRPRQRRPRRVDPQVPRPPLRRAPQGHHQHRSRTATPSKPAAASSTSSHPAGAPRDQVPVPSSFEYEKDADDPLPGLAETVGYTKGLLASMGRLGLMKKENTDERIGRIDTGSEIRGRSVASVSSVFDPNPSRTSRSRSGTSASPCSRSATTPPRRR